MIIQSALDNDLYKFTMMQIILHKFPAATAEYKFKCRNVDIDFRAYAANIIKNINKMCRYVRFTEENIWCLSQIPYFKSDFLEFLKLFKFNYDYIHIVCDNDGTLHIHIKGPWLYTILFEVPILSIISEVYSTDMSMDFKEANRRSTEKFTKLYKFYEETGNIIYYSEFGGRRRHSVEAQDNCLNIAKQEAPKSLLGTSNVMMGNNHNIKVMGTMAHEWGQAHQALYRVEDSQHMMMENWAQEYRGELGIALSDVIGVKYFLHDFDKYFAKLFDGTRQDSGDPHEYAHQLVRHYTRLGIDPKTKTIVFSDGLTIDKAIEIYKEWHSQIGVSFGIGTFLTNDFDFTPLQIVLKMTKCNEKPVAKLSDSPGKTMCLDTSYVNYLQSVFEKRIKENTQWLNKYH